MGTEQRNKGSKRKGRDQNQNQNQEDKRAGLARGEAEGAGVVRNINEGKSPKIQKIIHRWSLQEERVQPMTNVAPWQTHTHSPPDAASMPPFMHKDACSTPLSSSLVVHLNTASIVATKRRCRASFLPLPSVSFGSQTLSLFAGS